MSNDHNYKEVTSTTLDKQKLEELIARLSVDSDEEFVGAGQRAVNPERAIQFILEKERKLKALEKSHHTLLRQIQDRINELQAQIDVLQGKIDKLTVEIDENKEKIAKYDEQLAKLKAEGKEGTPEYLAMLAARNALADDNEELIDLRNDYEDQRDIAKEELDRLDGLEANSMEKVTIIKDIPVEMEALKEKIRNNPKNPELLQELIDLEDKIGVLEDEIEVLEKTFKGSYENQNTFAKLDSADKIVLKATDIEEKETDWLIDDFDMDDFDDEFSSAKNQLAIEDELLKNPISDPTGGSLTAQVNAAFNPDQHQTHSPVGEPEKVPSTTFGLG